MSAKLPFICEASCSAFFSISSKSSTSLPPTTAIAKRRRSLCFFGGVVERFSVDRKANRLHDDVKTARSVLQRRLLRSRISYKLNTENDSISFNMYTDL